MCDRFSISDRSAAYLANALLKDIRNISEYNQRSIIYQSKIRRERMKQRNLKITKTSGILSLCFDGKREDTIAQIMVIELK